jgi:hypothetical protein
LNKIIQTLLLAALLIGLSGCGTNVGSAGTGSDAPDHVRIQIDAPTPDPAQGKRVVTLSVATLVQQLYTTTFALPQMPQGIPCTMEAGPHYTLTFQQGAKTLETIVAKREGCQPVSIVGETQDRQASRDFWSQLDQAIHQAH